MISLVIIHELLSFKGSVLSVSLYHFGKEIRLISESDFFTLTNDVTVLNPVANITSADFTLDGRDCSFKKRN